ncbi:hypothetical protein ACIRL2_29070 [Embleya sp. NPDC127516]|uniref:hypothetical protein n=1 Tax=Embleya sp. NPDC127516 TaxID=3363990 RepID=UPI0037F249E7
MAFPQSPLPVEVAVRIGTAWTDITSDVYLRDRITITRGRADEGARVDAGRCSLTLNNRSGKYSPRNPTSPYYGQIGRNTPVRVSVLAGPSYLDAPGGAGDRATTPDHAALDITGDLDVRIDATLPDWRTPDTVELIGKYLPTGNQRSWRLITFGGGTLFFGWSTDGTSVLQAGATAPLDIPPSGRLAVRVTLDVNNGAGGNTVVFYTAPTIAGPWTALGDPIVTAGTTSVYASTAPLQIADVADLVFTPLVGRVHAAQVRNGIAGTVVANPDFTAQAPGTTTFADSAGRTWTLGGAATITNRRTRFVGEVSAWPSRWDVSGRDVWVPVEAAGILRRLGQGASPLDSTLRRRIPSRAPLAYWPMEDDRDATQAYSPLAGIAPLEVSGLTFADGDGLAGSRALPALAAGAKLGGTVPAPAAPTGQWSVQFVFRLAASAAAETPLSEWRTTGTIVRWVVAVQGATAIITGYNLIGGIVVDQAIGFADVTDVWCRQQFRAVQEGTLVRWTLRWDTIGGSAGQYENTYTGTTGQVTAIDTTLGADLAGTHVGHLAVFASPAIDAYEFADHGFNNEAAGVRIRRLCDEEGVPAFAAGVLAEQMPLGPQRPATLLALLGDSADADGGILTEARDRTALTYRPRTSLYNQAAALALDYATPGEVAPPLEPVDDDQAVRNDITVSREGGSSARLVDQTSPLSVLAPPAGIGRYDESVTLNLTDDTQPEPIAGWRLHLGTWSEARYPTVHVDLAAAPHLITAATTLDVGDRLTITHPPAWLPPDPIDLLVQGYTETLGVHDWDLVLNASPAGPWYVGTVETDRVDTDGSKLAAGVTATAGTLSVAVTAGPLWTTSGAEMPVDIRVGGEVMTVTAISGTSSPQTFTVTRSVNGVVKAQLADADVRLARPAIVAL